ncbi:unnamed protein product [Meloidogyne enterolobii]|uniref:Uncharacterized protein n=1 Tax=Meloidogyne enterolobii TaxID=390850 RepID=A0ACB0YAN9_MELEN
MFKKFNTIVILFFILKNYSEGAPRKRKGETSGQQTQENANYFEGGGSSFVPALNFSCKWDGCGQVFDNEQTFVEHVKEHAKMEKGPHPYCRWSSCNERKPFLRKNFAQHIRTHTQEKPYVCEIIHDGVRCNKSFTSNTSLKDHQRRYTEEIIIEHKCKFCEKVNNYIYF